MDIQIYTVMHHITAPDYYSLLIYLFLIIIINVVCVRVCVFVNIISLLLTIYDNTRRIVFNL